MIVAALVIACLAMLVALITSLALVEAYEGIALLQELNGFNDEARPMPIDELIGTTPGRYGLPSHLDRGNWTVLLLSTRCATCHHVVKGMGGVIPESTHLMVTNSPGPLAREWLEKYNISPDTCTIDDDRVIADALGIDTTPVVLMINEGEFTQALIVPSSPAFTTLMESRRQEASYLEEVVGD